MRQLHSLFYFPQFVQYHFSFMFIQAIWLAAHNCNHARGSFILVYHEFSAPEWEVSCPKIWFTTWQALFSVMGRDGFQVQSKRDFICLDNQLISICHPTTRATLSTIWGAWDGKSVKVSPFHSEHLKVNFPNLSCNLESPLPQGNHFEIEMLSNNGDLISQCKLAQLGVPISTAFICFSWSWRKLFCHKLHSMQGFSLRTRMYLFFYWVLEISLITFNNPRGFCLYNKSNRKESVDAGGIS